MNLFLLLFSMGCLAAIPYAYFQGRYDECRKYRREWAEANEEEDSL